MIANLVGILHAYVIARQYHVAPAGNPGPSACTVRHFPSFPIYNPYHIVTCYVGFIIKEGIKKHVSVITSCLAQIALMVKVSDFKEDIEQLMLQLSLKGKFKIMEVGT